jgi:hypothetical protein
MFFMASLACCADKVTNAKASKQTPEKSYCKKRKDKQHDSSRDVKICYQAGK